MSTPRFQPGRRTTPTPQSGSRAGMRASVLAVGDEALGFWNALREVFPSASAHHQPDRFEREVAGRHD